MNKKWMDYYLGIAAHVSTASKDTTRVGAVLVEPEGSVILTAFNGPPKGVQDLPERFVRPEKYLYASHAEQNLIAFAARHGIMTKGCSVVVTHCPCCDCTKSLIQAGIARVVYGTGTFQYGGTESEIAALNMFSEAGVELVNIMEFVSTQS